MYYQIEGTKVRLLGTMHAVPAADPTSADWVSTAGRWCEKLWLETQFGGLEWLDSLTYPPPATLAKILPPRTLARLQEVWPARFPVLSNQRLWFVVTQLLLANIEMAQGAEAVLAKIAKSNDTPIAYLETTAEFVALADAVPNENYIRVIDCVLVELPRAAMIVREIHQAWLRGTVNAMSEVLPRTVFGMDEVIKKAAIDDRNLNWMPAILAACKEHECNTLFAVGALHFVGPRGLLQLLKDQGYEYSDVPPP